MVMLPFLSKLVKAEDGLKPGEMYQKCVKIKPNLDKYYTVADKYKQEYSYYHIDKLKYQFSSYRELEQFVLEEFHGKNVHLYIPCESCNGQRYNTGSVAFKYFATRIQCPKCLNYSKNRYND